MQRRRSTRGSSGGWEEPGRSYHDALGWISQQKRLIETAPWGEDPAAIEQQLHNHQRFHSSIQRSLEVDRARDDLFKKGDKGNLHGLEQEWDSLQQLSFTRKEQLQELQAIILEISKEIMWVNDREEEELVFDWGDKNIDQYIPKKQESYSKLMSALEDKEVDLNKLKAKVDTLLKNGHPASDKIKAYQDTLQTQWSWLLQITKCIDVHLKENAAYNQFFKESNETYNNLTKQHESVRKKFTCDKETSLENLLDLLRGLEREKEKILENKRQVQHLVNKSKSIVRLKPRNPEEKSSNTVIVKALCDFKQDQKVIHKDNEAILKDNSQRSKWEVTGPGGLDMLVPSVCLIIPPPNPLSISIANKNELYYESILSIWNQLYINVKSLIAWQYCLLDIKQIRSLTISMLAKMHPEEYRQIMKNLETHYEEFKLNSQGSQMFADDDKRSIENQYNGAQAYYEQMVVQLPTYSYVARAEDLVKVHEARLTEKETTSLSLSEVKDYMLTLENIKAELQQKQEVMASVDAELLKASHWSCQMGGDFHQCDIMLSKYTEQVGLLSDRWRRIQGQIDTRYVSLIFTSNSLYCQPENLHRSGWHCFLLCRQHIDNIQTFDNLTLLFLKALNAEIKARRDTLDSVLKDNEACMHSIKDYETDLASYTSGLETLLNIPIKRTMLRSPAMDLNQEAVQLQTRYMELFTMSGDYYKYLGELLKNMEELKICNTRIDLLEEQLRQLREDIQDRNAKNKSLEDAVARYQVELSQSQGQLQCIEEVKRNAAMQCSASKDSLDTTQSQLSDLNEQVSRLTYLLDEEKRKRRLAEERYTHQQNEYESVLRKRQNELETVSWSKMELEKNVATKQHEIELLQQQLKEESSRAKELQKEISKVRSQCSAEMNELKLSYESQMCVSRTDIQRLTAQREEDTAELQMQYDRMVADRRSLEEELRRLRVSLSQAEEHKKKAEEEAYRQRAVITEEGRKRRELESEVEEQMKQRAQESSKYREELAEAMKALQEKSEELVYIRHSLEEETRRRKTTEEEQSVFEDTLAKLQGKLNDSSFAATQLTECKEEVEKLRLEVERESRERSRVEEKLSRLQGRIKDVQDVRDGLESQVENLRMANQEEVARRQQIEAELEKSMMALKEHTSTVTALHQKLEQSSTFAKRGEEEHHSLQEELESSLRQNKTSAEKITQLSTELKALQKQLLQEQDRVKESNVRNETLYRTLEEKSKTLNETIGELQRLKVMAETQTKERLRLEEELRTARRDNEELLKSKLERDDELSSQINTMQLQLQASERSNAEYRNLVSEVSSEREKLKLETEKIQKQASEVHGSLITARMQSIQSQYNEVVTERDELLRKIQLSGKDKDRVQTLEDELSRIKLSLDSEIRNKQRLQEENDRVKRDLDYWKGQYESQQSLIRQCDTDKERLEREKNKLRTELERLMRELKELEETYKSKLSALKTELQELNIVKQTMENDLKATKETPTLDTSSVIFDGVRKPVTANQLLDCGVLDKPTFSQLAKGHKTVPEVAADKKVSLKGTGPIAGVVLEGPVSAGSSSGLLSKLSLTEAKKENLLPPDCVDLLLDAQAATGHIIDPRTNQKLTVDEAYKERVIDGEDLQRLLAAEAAAVGYRHPGTSKPLSAFHAMKKGVLDKNTTLRLLQAQESVGGILDPELSVFLPKDTAVERDLIDDDIYRTLNRKPKLYLDPESEDGATYMAMKRRCKVELHTGLLFLPVSEKTDASKLVFDGVRKPVTAKQLLDCGIIDAQTFKNLEKGKKTVQEVTIDKNVNLKGSTCIAGVYDEANDKVLSIYEAMKDGLLRPGTTLELLEAQAASGFIVDPVNNQYLTVTDAYNKRLFGPELKDKLLSAEQAVNGYKLPGTNKKISLFQAIEKGLVERGHGIRLLEAQIASGGIIDPEHSHRIDINVAYERGYLDEKMNRILSSESAETKGFFDPNTEENLTYKGLKKSCITDKKSGLLLLSINDKSKSESTLRKRRVVIVDPETNKEMTVREAYDKGYIDYKTFIELSEQECEWEEITITAPDGSVQFFINDKKTGRQYDITELLEKGVIDQSVLEQYRSRMTTTRTTITERSGTNSRDARNSSDALKHISSVSIAVASPVDSLGEQEPVGAIFDTELLEKISITEALERGLVDSITAQRLLEAQACTGGIIDPSNGRRLGIQEAARQGIINDDMISKLKPAQKAYFGFEDVKTRKKISVAQAMKEMWLPYEAGQRFMEFQYVTKGLYDPELGCRRSIEDALKMGWLDGRSAQKLQDVRHHAKILTCPKSKLKISYKDALDSCLVEKGTGVKMLPASTVSSRGISSPYNASSTSGSATNSRSGSRRGSRRGSMDLGSPSSLTTSYGQTSFIEFSSK
uniref:Desmoplakin-like n=1 Tax=Echeneis naucrates TaxID=173247 RepID=A0A665WUZ4_ECHNA